MSNMPIETAADNDVTETPVARISTFVSDHPLAMAGAAIAAGAVIGMLLPRWRLAATAGTTILTTATKAAKTIAAAETVRTVISGLNTASSSVKTGAHRVTDHLPDMDAVKAGAKRALEHASETAQKAGEKVANTARRTIKSGED